MGAKFQEQLRAHAPDLYERSLVPLDETEQGSSSSSSSSSSYSSSSASERSEDEEDDERLHDAEARRARKRSPSSPTWRDRAREGVERECEEAEVSAEVNAEMGGRNQRQRLGHSPGDGEEGCQELDENGAHRK
jgi:hypothetical protein